MTDIPIGRGYIQSVFIIDSDLGGVYGQVETIQSKMVLDYGYLHSYTHREGYEFGVWVLALAMSCRLTPDEAQLSWR